jgi:PadR family transcriptional regulator PadR
MEVAILTSLTETTSHGYELVDQLDALASELVCIDAGSMYRLLRTMEEEGLVSSSWETPESGPGRRVYVITDQGLEALEVMAHSLSQRATSMQELADRARQAIGRSQAGTKSGGTGQVKG